jgi:hypothetical protein
MVHCCLFPIIISAFPIVGLAIFANHQIEMVFISLSGLLAMSSLCWGIRKHKRFSILAVAAGGFALLALGHISEDSIYGGFIAGGGGLCICLSHLINFKLCKSCNTCH